MSKSEIDIHLIDFKLVRSLRSIVLRPGLPLETCIYPNDEQASHFGAFIGKNKLVGIISYYNIPHREFNNIYSWQIRGMATLEKYRRIGIGKKLVKVGNDFVKLKKAKVVWCNARKVAVDFYKECNFKIISKEFDIPGIGPHFEMLIKL